MTATALGFVGEVEFRATALPGTPDKILAISGENQRGVAGDPLPLAFVVLVVDTKGNPVDDVPVSFEVTQGDGSFGRETTLTVNSDDNGRASAVLTLGPEEGLNNNVVNTSFPDLTGLPATFVASGVVPGQPEDTTVNGVVLDNSNISIPGATASIKGTGLDTTTDDQDR